MSDTAGKIRTILTGQLELSDEKVSDSARIVDDLGADSLDLVELIAILEEEFGVDIPDKDGDKLATVGDLAEYIDRKVACK